MIPLTLLTVAGMVLGIIAGNSDPREHMLVAFFGLAFPFFLAGNVMLLLYWLVRKNWVLFCLIVVVCVLGIKPLRATFGFIGETGGEQKEESSLLRVMTYNVHNFSPYGEVITEETKGKMLDVVKGQMPDVVCFQEFYTRKKGRYDIATSVRGLLGTDYYYFEPSMKSEREAIGMAIFSRYPIKATGKIHFPGEKGNASIYADLEVGSKKIRVYNIHLQSISFDKEDYTYLDEVTQKMDPQYKSSKRIVRMLRDAFRKRSVQVDIMKDHMRGCETPYVIAGDFNDTPASYAVTKITDSLDNAFVKKGMGLGKTYNGKFPNFQIDYIAVSKDIEVMNYQIIKAKLSDHFPVRSDLRLRN